MNSEIRKILFRIIFVSSRVDNSIYDMVYIRFDIESRSHGWEVRIESYVIECGAERRKMLKYWKINGKDWILKYERYYFVSPSFRPESTTAYMVYIRFDIGSRSHGWEVRKLGWKLCNRMWSRTEKDVKILEN